MNGSPTCGVELSWAEDEEKQEPGELIRILQEKLEQIGFNVPMKGIKAYEPAEAVAAVKDLIFFLKK